MASKKVSKKPAPAMGKKGGKAAAKGCKPC